MKKGLQIAMSFMMTMVLAGMAEAKMVEFGAPGGSGTVLMLLVVLVMALMPRKELPGVQMNDEYAEMWLREIIKRLWKQNKFLNYATNEDEYVVGGRIVHIPQPGARPTVVKNRNSFPATVVRRTDSDITYQLDEYTTDPSHLPYKQIAEISYDKLSSLLEDHFGYLLQDVADDILYKWVDALPSTNIINTTGAATEASTTGQTGQRLAMVSADLKKARLILNTQNVPEEGRIAVIESNMLEQLTDSLSQTQYRDFSRAYNEKDGTVGQLFGFNIIERSSVITAQAALDGSSQLQANDFETVVGATDNVGCICYHPSAVSRALGERKLFSNPDRAEYYGHINSALLRMGGRRRRDDNKGVVAIMQAAAGGV